MIPLYDNVPAERSPFVTVGLIVINAAVFLFLVTMPDGERMSLLFQYGFIPGRIFSPARVQQFYLANFHHFQFVPPAQYSIIDGLFPAFTSMFLHGGWLHIIGNMWILWIFGNNVEDRLGHVFFLLFYIVCGLTSAVVHTLSAPTSPVVTVGASGAIAGVMGAYLLLYPRAWVFTIIPIFIILYPAWVPAFVFLIVWFAIQIFSGAISMTNGDVLAGGIAWWAHVGGFVAGAVFVLLTGMHGDREYRTRNHRRAYSVFGHPQRSRPDDEW